jgi:uncharacterized membrane protein
MMQDQIIVAVFPSQSVLLKALDLLLEDAASDIRQAAVVAKSKTGDILFLDDTLSQEEGGVVGGLVGGAMGSLGLAALGALTLPMFNAVLVFGVASLLGGLLGWILGQLVARAYRSGFGSDVIEALSGKLQEGRPALVLHAKDAARLLPRLRDQLKQAEIVARLRELR